MSNKIKYGLSNVHYAKITETEGVITYGTPVAIPGAVNVTLSAEGESDSFYADDMDYYNWSTNDGYGGNLEIALIPDSFRTDILGEVADDSGALFENIDAVIEKFALLFEFKGDKNATRHILYKVSATRPNLESETKTNTITPSTDTLEIIAKAGTNGYVKAKAKPADSSYDGWYTEVYEFTPEA